MRERKSGTGHPKHSDELPKGVFDEIAGMLSTEEALLPMEAGNLELSYQDGYAVVVLDEDEGNKVVGFTRLQFLFAGTPANPAWLELGSTWVHGDYRRQGINIEMYSRFLPHHVDENIVATTTEPGALKAGEYHGFVLVPRRSLPEHVWRSSCNCPIKKTHATSDSNDDCKLAYGEPQRSGDKTCWLRVTPETARRHNFVSHTTQ